MRLVEAHQLVRIIISGSLKTPISTAITTKLVEQHTEIALVNETTFYDQSITVGIKSEEANPSMLLNEGTLALLFIFEYEENVRAEEGSFALL